MLEDKLVSLEDHIRELERLRTYMEQIVGNWRSRVGQIETGKRVHLLQSLMAAPTARARNGNLQRRRTKE
jgi:hypothetical protein